jgi:hypothetical protein
MRAGRLGLVVLALGAGVALLYLLVDRPVPSDQTPEGAYTRIALALTRERVKDAFPYLETEAQWAAYTIRDERAKAVKRIQASYPEPQRSELLSAYHAFADAADGSDVFVLLAEQRGWGGRLRRDLSGVDHVELEGERASIVTVRGTRYSFRRRADGIWGLTLFSADLVAESQRASRDLAVVEAAADDYARASPQ